MHVDLVHTCYFEKSKGNNTNFDRLTNWMEQAKLVPGNKFEVNGKDFEWKLLNAYELNDIIYDDYTDWVLIRALDNSFEAIGKRRKPEIDNAGSPISVTFSTIWIFKSDIPKLEVHEKPISIWCPHIFRTPIHRINYDFKLLMKRLYDPKVRITQFVEYKKFKTDTIQIR